MAERESSADSASTTQARVAELFQEQYRNLVVRTDRMFAILMVLQWIAAIAAALVISPKTWAGTLSSTHFHVWAAILLGGAFTCYPVYLVLTRAGRPLTRHSIAVSQMLIAALLIHLSGGRIETHFHIFGSLAFLAVYRDRRVLLSAAVVVVVDHLIRGIYWPQSVYGVLTAPAWRSLEHAGWVVFELTFLFVAIRQGIREMWAIAERQAGLEETNQNIEQKVRERTVELEQAEARTRAILETAADGIITIDDNGIIQSFNPAAEKIFGYPASEVIGQNVSTLMPPDHGVLHDGYLRNYLETGERKIIGIGREVVGVRSDGTTFPLDLSVSESRGGVFTGLVRDISERKAVDRMKTEFISTVSHELRTPLTSIRGSLGLIAGGVAGEMSEKAQTLLTIALNNSERLVRLVNDILDIEKIESGKMQFHMEREDITELVKSAVKSNLAYGEQFGVRFELGEVIPEAIVEGDSDRILQVLANLLSNGAKFSPRGEAVTISILSGEKGPRVEVTDRGPGISEEFQSRIFGKFAQADGSDSREKGGTGLGLSISKAIVEMHGGDIGFRTTKGKGTTFYFELPRLTPVESEEPDLSLPAPGLHGPRVLVCEDDPDIRKLLTFMLRERSFVVDSVSNAEDAQARLATSHYDAMTLDLMLPGLSGIQLLRELRRHESTRELPVVVISAKAREGQTELSGEAFGVIDWMDKPIDEDHLAVAVQTAVQRGSSSGSENGPSRILHVEDDLDLHKVVANVLEPLAEVVHAPCLATARRLLAESEFDAVLLDIDLPDGSGLSLVPHLSERPQPVPVVVFSAAEVEGELEARVSAALVKSRTSNEKLAETISRLITRADIPTVKQGQGNDQSEGAPTTEKFSIASR